MELAERLQKLRKEKGYSQEELGDVLGISRQAISKWESGQSFPDINNLLKLSDIYGVTTDFLLKGEDSYKDCDEESESHKSSRIYHFYGRVEYEYVSKKKIFGVPLLHINIGRGLKKAKGIIAVGNISIGLLSIGMISAGVFSIGLLSLGIISLAMLGIGILVSLGAISIGTLAVGGIAIGIYTIGGLSIGVYSIGGCSIASKVAIGGYARGHLAIGNEAIGERVINVVNNKFSSISADEVINVVKEEFPNLSTFTKGWIKLVFK